MIDSSDDSRKAHLSIRVNCEFCSNKIDENDLQPLKHKEPRMSTPHGIIIDCSAEYWNASDSIRDNRESDSNEIDESDVHPEKQNEPRISTLDGS
jgi:hypothetical protein